MEHKDLRKRFQEFADRIVWSNDDGSEKYIGVGNMADWWINEIEFALTKQRKEFTQKVKERDSKMYGYYKSVFKDDYEGGYPAEWDDFMV